MKRLARLPRLRNAYLRRGIGVWLLCRFVLAAQPGGGLALDLRTTVALLAVVVVVVLMYARRRWENVLLGNLGIPMAQAAAWAAAVPAVAELLMPGPSPEQGTPGNPGSVPPHDPARRAAASSRKIIPLLAVGAAGTSPLAPGRPDAGAFVLHADGLGKSFGRKSVLKSASFRAVSGQVTALMGRNGSGKTTMLRISAGALGAGWGSVFWRGEYRERPRLHRLAREGLFFSAQESALTSHFTVREHLEMVVRTFGGRERMDDVVHRMRLEAFLDRRPHRISGGERQRASLAMALLRDPVCLLMDEPFAGIAPADRPLIAAGLGVLRDGGCAIVVSGHDVEDLFQVSDQVIWVVAGTTHWLGGPSEAALHPQFRREYLGPRGQI
ncbi:MAG: ABC transporter ATP-binding protein [Gemmatimonadales bacterium]|nr:MAG: ABC transporter ATP-binding protein [Gemmatimonadales bacterium]